MQILSRKTELLIEISIKEGRCKDLQNFSLTAWEFSHVDCYGREGKNEGDKSNDYRGTRKQLYILVFRIRQELGSVKTSQMVSLYIRILIDYQELTYRN